VKRMLFINLAIHKVLLVKLNIVEMLFYRDFRDVLYYYLNNVYIIHQLCLCAYNQPIEIWCDVCMYYYKWQNYKPYNNQQF
jgi:hypothetical protein